jgi:hypothetical protein
MGLKSVPFVGFTAFRDVIKGLSLLGLSLAFHHAAKSYVSGQLILIIFYLFMM